MIKENLAIIVAILSLALSSCNGTDLAIYYNSEALPLESYEAIPKGKQSRVIEVIDFKAAQERYRAAGYVVIGSMSFVGTRITQGEVADFAKQKGASLVIFASEQKGTQTRSYAVPHTTRSTSYSSGTISNTGFSSSPNTAYYSGTTSTSSTEWQYHQYKVGLYKNAFIFLAKKR